MTVCDALIVFSKNIGDKEPQKTLVYEPDKSLQNQLSSFLMDKVFIEDDDGKWRVCELKLFTGNCETLVLAGF